MIQWHDTLPSTMDEAHRQAREGAPHGAAVAARAQAAGRGRRGRAWSSEAGGLWMSVICRPASQEGLECLGLRVGLSVSRCLEATVPVATALALKWPNDILLDGLKVAGILCESRWDGPRLGWVVVGIGINLSNPLASELAGAATGLTPSVGSPNLETIAEAVRLAIAASGAWAGPLTDAELTEFARRDCLMGRPVSAPVTGWAAGITATGWLRIRTEAGTITEVSAGDPIAVG